MRLLLIAAMLPLAACNSNAERRDGSSATSQAGSASRSFPIGSFDGIELRGPDDVDVKAGPAFSVTADGDPALLDKLDIRVVNGDLRIDRQKDGSWFGNNSKGVRIHVTAPRLSDAEITGAGSLAVERLEGDVDLSILGAGDLSVAAIRATDTELSITGAGDIKVAGTTQRLKASIRGTGDIDASGLAATGAQISITGTGGVRGHVNGNASIDVMGPGDVELTGGARCTTRNTGPGDVRCS